VIFRGSWSKQVQITPAGIPIGDDNKKYAHSLKLSEKVVVATTTEASPGMNNETQ